MTGYSLGEYGLNGNWYSFLNPNSQVKSLVFKDKQYVLVPSQTAKFINFTAPSW
jgi:hypothetical protein